MFVAEYFPQFQGSKSDFPVKRKGPLMWQVLRRISFIWSVYSGPREGPARAITVNWSKTLTFYPFSVHLPNAAVKVSVSDVSVKTLTFPLSVCLQMTTCLAKGTPPPSPPQRHKLTCYDFHIYSPLHSFLLNMLKQAIYTGCPKTVTHFHGIKPRIDFCVLLLQAFVYLVIMKYIRQTIRYLSVTFTD